MSDYFDERAEYVAYNAIVQLKELRELVAVLKKRGGYHGMPKLLEDVRDALEEVEAEAR